MNVYHHQLNDQQRQNINQALEANHPAIHPVISKFIITLFILEVILPNTSFF